MQFLTLRLCIFGLQLPNMHASCEEISAPFFSLSLRGTRGKGARESASLIFLPSIFLPAFRLRFSALRLALILFGSVTKKPVQRRPGLHGLDDALLRTVFSQRPIDGTQKGV